MARQLSKYLAALVLLSAIGSCGKAGSGGDSSATSFGSTEETISGSVVSQTGGAREMAGWIVALIERDSGVMRVSEVDQAGSFSLKGVDSTKFHTVTLLSPDYKVAAVLSIPGAKAATVRQYFKLRTKALPRLIHKGQIVEFFSTANIEIASGSALDSDADRTPDGIDSTPTGAFHGLLAAADTDNDGIPNEIDLDIDGDGIPNMFDTDADGDGTPNVFDTDANGDGILDSAQKVGLQYYSDGVEYIAVQVFAEPQDDGSDLYYLKISTKLRDGVAPVGVRVRGPQALLNAATVETTDSATQQTVSQPFDGNLTVDADSDRIYSRNILLASGKMPKSNQAIFVQLAFGTSPNNWFKEFAYTFPSVTLGAVTGSYDSNLSTISFTGTPFGSIDAFYWSAEIYDADGGRVTSTGTEIGTTTLQSIPADTLEAGQSYELVIYAQSIDPIPGFPAYIVKSLPVGI